MRGASFRSFVLTPAWAGGFLLVYLTGYSLLISMAPYSLLVGTLGRIIPVGVATYAAIKAGRHSPNPVLRRIWYFFSVGMLLWTSASTADLVGILIDRPRTGGVSIGDVLLLAGYAALGLGCLVILREKPRQFGRLHLIIDLAVSTTALAALTWIVFLQPLAAQRSLEPIWLVWINIYPILDIVLLTGMANLYLVTEERDQRATLSLVSSGILLTLLSDLLTAYLPLIGEARAAPLASLGWVIAPCLFALGAWLALKPQPNGPQPNARTLGLQKTIQSLLPLASTLVLSWFGLAQNQLSGQNGSVMVAILVFCGVGLILQQGVVAGEIELQEYALLLDHSADPAFLCNRQGLLLITNPAFRNSLGYAQDANLTTTHFSSAIQDRQEIDSLLAQPGPLDWSGEVIFQRKDGSSFPVELSLRSIDPPPPGRRDSWLVPRRKQAYLVGTAHDLTQIKLQQMALRQAYAQVAAARGDLETLNTQLSQIVEDKTRGLSEAAAQLERQNRTLQQLDELKSDFVSLVSHELRAPLTNISGGIELVLSAKGLADPARQTLSLVQVEIQRLNHFVESILDLSALDAGREPIYPAPISLDHLLGLLKQQLATQPEYPRVVWLIPERLPFVMADDRATASVLFHLIDNGLKYAEEGPVDVRAWDETGRVYVQVADRGPGIPQESIPLLFEKFYRLHPRDSQTVYGHGLGLYMARRLLQAMHGEITVENRAGGGTCFTFWLPAVQDPGGQ